jgi:hypothetical protein
MTDAIKYDGNGNAIQTLQATVTGPTLAAGIIGNGSLSYDGNGDLVSIPPSSLDIGTSSFTTTFWANIPQGTVGRHIFMGNHRLAGAPGQISFETDSPQSPDQAYLWWVNGQRLEFWSPRDMNVRNGANHLIALSRDEINSKWQVTIDGELFYEYLASAGADIPFLQATNFFIGCWGPADCSNLSFKGIMDDVRFYNRTLTPEEHRIIYSLGNHP